jgi:4-diphosphocytidyl-2-C-methyl-D-erythritol kinase
MPTIVNAYAKINLTLEITGKRADGYHLLRMVMQSVSLCDRLTLTNSEPGIRIRCARVDVPSGKDNTVYKAAEAYFAFAGLEPALCVEIEKNIPSQAGLGGGSADAAAVLLALNEMYHTGYSKETLCEIGLKAGADVPFCVLGGTALVEGIGEKLTALPDLPPCYIVICKPSVGVNTQKAFALVDSAPRSEHFYTDTMLDALRRADLVGIAAGLGNDFERVLNLADVNRIKGKMLSAGALGSCMTGSGSAVFGIFADQGKALACKELLGKEYKDVFLCEPVNEI